MSKFELRQYSLLFITALIWGSGFIGQKLGMDHVEPFTFTFARTLIGGLFLIPVMAALSRLRAKKGLPPVKSPKKQLLWGSFFCGLCLIAAESFQQFGIAVSDVSKASFITSLYVVMVPILAIALGTRPSLKIWICVAVAVFGLYLLCIRDELAFAKGDVLLFLCAVIFAVHILVIAHFVRFVDGVALSCGQFFVASFLGLVMMIVSGGDTLENFLLAAPAFIYCGIMSNGVAYTLQVVGQRGVNATIATLILSLESVTGTVFGIVLLGESLTLRQFSGCVLMFAAVVVSQIPLKDLLRLTKRA